MMMIALLAAVTELTRYDFSQMHMGVVVRVTLFAENSSTANKAAQAAFDRFRTIDEVASDYILASELNQFSNKAGSGWIPLSSDLYPLLKQSLRFAVLTDGDFDITVGPMVRLWREARQAGKMPDPVQLEEARSRSGYEKLSLRSAQPPNFRKSPSPMKMEAGQTAPAVGRGQLRHSDSPHCQFHPILLTPEPPNLSECSPHKNGGSWLAPARLKGASRTPQPPNLLTPKLPNLTSEGSLTIPGMKLDLGGIAKGYACDEAILAIGKVGISSALINAGGDIALSGPPPGTKGWQIEIPALKKMLTLANCAISTSGDAEQFVLIDGVRYSHILNPKTGIGLTNQIQATVIARWGSLTDPLATVACIDPVKAEILVKRFGGVVYFQGR